MFKTISEAGDLNGKHVLVRVDWNVPIQDGVVQDDFRIKESLKTLSFLKDAGAQVVIMTHLDPDDASIDPLKSYAPEGMELLPNLRNDPREKANDESFARELAAKGDIYVNEAFSCSHRAHASIVGVPKLLPSYAGFRFADEVANLSKAFNPPHPFLFILGGAKFETKLPLVKKFQTIADDIFIGGLNAKLASEQGFGEFKNISFPSLSLAGDLSALDFDPESFANCKMKIENAAFVLWNGPLGQYETGHTQGTEKLAQMLADSGKEVVVGGADTLTAIKTLNLFDKFSFVSTAGGAMLDFLANGTLAGIEALGN